MKKPDSYDEVQTGSDYIPIEVGGHHAIIMGVKEQISSTNKPMAVVALDFAKNDKQPGYFKNQFDNDTRDGKKWPYQAVQYIVTEDQDGKCSKSFKSFITAFEKSNNTTVTWGDKFTQQFKNKKIGVVYGEVEEEYQGEVKTRRRIRWFCEDAKADDASIPDKKYLNNGSGSGSSTSASDIVNIPDDVDDDSIPFD